MLQTFLQHCRLLVSACSAIAPIPLLFFIVKCLANVYSPIEGSVRVLEARGNILVARIGSVPAAEVE